MINERYAKTLTIVFVCFMYGTGYGYHMDDPIMANSASPGEKLRSDIAITIFLNTPDSYDGGVLEIKTASASKTHRGNAGDAIMYPANTLHRVTEVTRGYREVAVTWMQSMVPDPARREILYQLYSVKEALYNQDPESETFEKANTAYLNLVRQWARI